MAFNMNKPVIKGTTKHSALLAKAEEATRTHGVDPTLGAAAMAYGESNSPNVVDYNIKTREIKWDKENQPKRGPKKPKQGKFNDWLKETVKKAKTKINDSINILKKNTDDGTGENGTNENRTDGGGTGENRTVIIDGDGVEMEFTPEQQTAISDDQARLKKSQLDLSIESKPYEYPEPKIDWDSLSEEEKEDPDVVPKRTRQNIMKIHKDTDPNAVLAENNPKYKTQPGTMGDPEGGNTSVSGIGPHTHSENEEENYRWVEKDGYKGYVYIGENGYMHPQNSVNVPKNLRVALQTRDGKINEIKKQSHIVTEDGELIKNTRWNKKKIEKAKEKQKTETETPQEEIVSVVPENLQTSTPKEKLPARLRNEYDKLSTWDKSKFRKKHKKYQF